MERDRSCIVAQVGERLVVLRVARGIDVESAAAAASIEPERLAEAEEGGLALAESELDRLAAAYGIDVTAVFGGRVTPLSYLAGT